MLPPADRSAEAMRLEEIDYSQSANDGLREADAEIMALKRNQAARGGNITGPALIKEMEIRFTKVVANPAQRVIAKRRELGRRFPELFTKYRLDQLRETLCRRADSFVEAQMRMAAAGLPGHRGAVSGSLIRQAEIWAAGLKSRIAQDLEALSIEAGLGMHKEQKPVTMNISHSTIASLNLGTVIGDITASVQVLNSQGQNEQEFARAIQALAEALAASTEVQQDRQKELLEHLSLVSEQMAYPAEKRKMGLVKSSLAKLREGLATVTALAGLWGQAEHVLKTLGILS